MGGMRGVFLDGESYHLVSYEHDNGVGFNILRSWGAVTGRRLVS